ncbi:MAG: M23 family metallopeptidase [Archangiaceae bacterium]|nr:M23 family metallopeptidase [Archangiaceae bacterium]
MASGKPKHKPISPTAIAVFIIVFLGVDYFALMKLVFDSSNEVIVPHARRLPTRAPVARNDREYSRESVTPTAANEPTPPPAPETEEILPLVWPIRATKLSSGFGHRINPVTHDAQVHRGVDVPVPCGTQVVAVEDGEVVASDWSDGAGNIIKIAHEGGWFTQYMHLARSLVRVGTKVKAGALIGFSGETGRLVTGPHLHFEVLKGRAAIDPTLFRYKLPPGPVSEVSPYASCGPRAYGGHASPTRLDREFSSMLSGGGR